MIGGYNEAIQKPRPNLPVIQMVDLMLGVGFTMISIERVRDMTTRANKLPSDTLPSLRAATWTLFAVCLLAASGCNEISNLGEDTSKKDRADKKPSRSIVSRITDVMLDTKIEFALGADLKMTLSECHVKWIPARAGYPAAVQIKSYDDPKSESFPSLFIQAVAPGDDLEAIQGQTLDAVIHLADSANGEVWHTIATDPAQIVIRNSDASGRVVGEISAATLVQVSTQERYSGSGSFDGHRIAD